MANDKVCNKCGDIGVSKDLVTCNCCKKTSEHIYCMNVRRKMIPVSWYCEECLKCRGVIHKEMEGKPINQMTVCCNNSSVKVTERLGKRSLGVGRDQARNSVVHNGTEDKSKKRKVIFGDSIEFNLKSSESLAKRSLGDGKNQTKAADGNRHNKHVRTKQNVSKGIALCPQTLQLPLPLTRNHDENLSTSHHAPEACWKGTFKIFEVIYHDYEGIRAHLPCISCPKVDKISKELPKTVTFKKILPRIEEWLKILRLDPPTKEDIGLYFFPSEQKRFKERNAHLLKRLDVHDFVLQACIKDTQLWIFSSNQLPQDSQRIRGEPYMWGVFRHMKCKDPSKHKGIKSLSTPAPTKPVDRYLAGHKENVNMYLPISRNMTPGFMPPNSKDFNHVRSSLTKSPLNTVADTADTYVPPGFSEIRTPRPSEPVSSRSDIQLDMKFKELDMVRNNNISTSDVLTPSIGTPTPDFFFKTRSRENDVVKRSSIEFPSNQLAPIVQDIPPGFNKISHRGFSGLPRSKHQDSFCDTMFNSPMLSRIDDKKDVEVPLKKMAVPIDPDVPPGFSKLLQPVSSKHWHGSWETPASVTVEFPSKKVANSIHFNIPPGFSKPPPPGFSEPLLSKQRRSSCNTTIHGAVQSSIDGVNCLPSITTGENISLASSDRDVKPMSFQASDDWCKSSEHPESKNLTLSLEENRSLYLLSSSKSCAKSHAPSGNIPSPATLERLCGSSSDHSSLMHRTVKVEMFEDEEIQRKDICTRRTFPDVPPGFSKLPGAGFSAVKTECPQGSENWCKSAEPPEASTLICSTENRKNCTESHPTSNNLPPSPTVENVCDLSDTPSGLHKTMKLEMLGEEKIDRRATSITRVDIGVPNILEKSSEKNRRDASMTQADTVPGSLEANLGKNKSPIRFSLKKVTSPIHASVPRCFLAGKPKELEGSSMSPCPAEVNDKYIVSSPKVESHVARAPNDCQVQSKCHKVTDCGDRSQKSAEHPTSNPAPCHVKEKTDFSSFVSPGANRKHRSVFENRASSASPLPPKKKAHCELSPSLSHESISAVKKILPEYKEKRRIEGRDRQRQGLKSENQTRDEEKLSSGDMSVASTHESPISSFHGDARTSLVSAFYGSPSIFHKSRANGTRS